MMDISQAVPGIEPESPEFFHTEVLSKSDVITTTLDGRYDVGNSYFNTYIYHAIATKRCFTCLFIFTTLR